MFRWVERETDGAGTSLPPGGLRTLSKREQLLILLGRRFGTKESEDLVDKHVKRFLRKCWNARADITLVINEVFGKSYEAGLVVEDEE
jgi:hypothetical protein